MKIRKALPGSALALLAALAGGDPCAAAEPAPLVQTAVVAETLVDHTVSAFGTLQCDSDALASINLPRAGVISRLAVRLGQRVAAGEPLFEIDTAPATRMDYLQAQAAVDFARSEAARVTRLLEQQLATREQLTAAKKERANAESRLDSLKQVGADRQLQIVRAPFAGVVTQLAITQGARVQADTAALLLGQQDRLIVLLGVEPEDARQIRPGQAVRLSPVFDQSVQLVSTVGAVHGLINPATRLVDVVVPIPVGQAELLTVGSIVRAEITLQSVAALTVPRHAVQVGGDGPYLLRVQGGRAERVSVEIESAAGGVVAVSGALHAGDHVVTQGSHELEDGMPVREAAP